MKIEPSICSVGKFDVNQAEKAAVESKRYFTAAIIESAVDLKRF
jgi:hypothetical protein